MAKTKTCRNCGWFKRYWIRDRGEVHKNFYINCTHPKIKKGYACGPHTAEQGKYQFRFHKRRIFLWDSIKNMKLKKMDKAIILVSVMFSISELLFLWEIIRGLEYAPRATGFVVLLFVNVIMVKSYLKHRHEYR